MFSRRIFLQHTAAVGGIAVAGSGLAPAMADTAQPSKLTAYKIHNAALSVSRLAYGCASLVATDKSPLMAQDVTKAAGLINTALEQGITLFDHADVYGFGKCEAVFGKVLAQSPGLRNRMVIQSKCGQRWVDERELSKGIRVDLSRVHIQRAVEGSLKRLGTDRLDILLLHAPDALVQPQEVAEAFDVLHSSGKVLHFGVSNFNPHQIALLKKYVRQPVVVNQINISLANPQPISDGLEFTLRIARGTLGRSDPMSITETGTFEYCRLNDIQVQAWGPLRGVLNAPSDASPQLKRVVQVLTDIAARKQSSVPVVALAWLLLHPADIVPILGGDKPEYLIENCAADRLELTREEWYELFVAAV